ncbi:MAG: hypothetical protein QXF70_03025 [Candidatus Bilamarchaeaceae archaeon]
MRKISLFVLFMLFSLFFSGAISKQYIHTQMGDGSAIITFKTKTAVLGAVDYEKIAEICSKKTDYSCSIDKENFSISIPLEKGSIYYSFSSDYGFPYTTSTLELKAIPTEIFTKKNQELLKEAGESVYSIETEPTMLNKKDTALSNFLRNSGDILYVVVMPGDVVSTTIGSKNGNSVSFTLSEAYAKGEPIIIKSIQPNTSLMIGVFMLLLLAALALFFFSKKRETQKETETPTMKKTRVKKR